MTEAQKTYYRQRSEVRQFLRDKRMSAWDLAKISKELCACGTCRMFVQHYTKDGEALDWGHCCKGNIQHSKKISTASCGFWDCDLPDEREEEGRTEVRCD